MFMTDGERLAFNILIGKAEDKKPFTDGERLKWPLLVRKYAYEEMTGPSWLMRMIYGRKSCVNW